MKIELFRTFLEVCNTLHFRIASEHLFITQSAVSARIKQLEDDLGVALFDRSQKQLKITPEGQRFIKHANDMIFMWQKARQDVGIAQSQSMQLVIGAIMSTWDTILLEWLQKIHRNLEDVRLDTHTYSTVEIRKNVINRVVDVAFLFEPPLIDELITKKIATVPLHLVTTDTQTPEDLIEDFIMVDYGDAINSQHLRECSDTLPVKHFMSQPRMALNFILQAGGSAYLPRQLTFEYIQKNRLAIVESAPTYSRDIYAIYLAKSDKRSLIEQALQLFPHMKT